jgi:ABC-type dipeptide/oligopeptide/nickel transport system permease component
MIFIYPLVRLSQGGETVFKWLGLGNLITVFINDSSVKTILIFFTSIGSFLIIVMIAFMAFSISLNKNTIEGQSKIRHMPSNIAYAVMLLILAAFGFVLINSLLNYLITEILNRSPIGSQSIPLYIYNSSFDDGIHQATSIPA